MKIAKKNNLKNIFLHKIYTPYYYKKIILKTFSKNKLITNNNLIKIKIDNVQKYRQISRQINLCKLSGSLKRTFNSVGVGRHQLRNLFNVNKIVHWKKNSW